MRSGAIPRATLRPRVEELEARECPAFSISYTSSLMVIHGHPTAPYVNPGDGLQLTRLASGLVQVREVGGAQVFNYGSYHQPQTIQINLDYTNADVTFDLGGGRVASNLLISLGK